MPPKPKKPIADKEATYEVIRELGPISGYDTIAELEQRGYQAPNGRIYTFFAILETEEFIESVPLSDPDQEPVKLGYRATGNPGDARLNAPLTPGILGL